MQIDVVWHAETDPNARYNCTAFLRDMLAKYDCVHHSKDDFPTKVDGGVVVVHGGRQPGSIDRLNLDIDAWKFALVIVLGDEEASYPVEQIEHSCRKIWIQEPIPGRHDFCDRFLLDGYTPHTRNIVLSLRPVEKDLDFVFLGQITHPRRRACADALRTIDWGGFVVETRGYCQGVSLEEYYRSLLRARIVPCPSGPFSPDSARVCEALECNAIPILDDLSPTRHEHGFWEMVLGPTHPFPIITDWQELPRMIKSVKSGWDNLNTHCQHFWKSYKADFATWLGKDIEELKNAASR